MQIVNIKIQKRRKITEYKREKCDNNVDFFANFILINGQMAGRNFGSILMFLVRGL